MEYPTKKEAGITDSILYTGRLKLRVGRNTILVLRVQRVLDKLVPCRGKDSSCGEVYLGEQAASLVRESLTLKQPDLVWGPS